MLREIPRIEVDGGATVERSDNGLDCTLHNHRGDDVVTLVFPTVQDAIDAAGQLLSRARETQLEIDRWRRAIRQACGALAETINDTLRPNATYDQVDALFATDLARLRERVSMINASHNVYYDDMGLDFAQAADHIPSQWGVKIAWPGETEEIVYGA